MTSEGGMNSILDFASRLGREDRDNGLPDISSLMQNPAMQRMARDIMNNPDLMNDLLNESQLQDMASRFSD